MYENPSIREMFRSLDLIESFGSGVGKAKRAMVQNGSDNIHYEDYDENIDITSVVIPINRKYLEYSNKAMGSFTKSANSKKPVSGTEKPDLDFDDKKLDIERPNLDIVYCTQYLGPTVSIG